MAERGIRATRNAGPPCHRFVMADRLLCLFEGKGLASLWRRRPFTAMSGDANIATLPLGGIKPFIRGFNHRLDAEKRILSFRDADADGRGDWLFFNVERIVRDGPAQAIRKGGGIRYRRIRHQDAKFIAAGACHQIRSALAVFEDAGDVQDGAVADVMPKVVIYAFETVDIDNGDAEGA